VPPRTGASRARQRDIADARDKAKKSKKAKKTALANGTPSVADKKPNPNRMAELPAFHLLYYPMALGLFSQ
jgi:hypothetical protein